MNSLITTPSVRPPNTLTLAITGFCNLTCAHCLVEAGGDRPAPDVPLPYIISLLDESATLGVAGIRISGGEPLCHPGCLDVMRHARQKGFRTIALQTNAMLLNDSHVTALREIDGVELSIEVSLDGSRAETHDALRGTGAFEGTIKGIGRLINAGLAERISIHFTETALNLEELPSLLALADNFGIRSVTSGTVLRSGRAAAANSVFPPSLVQYQRLRDHYETDERFRELYQKIGNVAVLEWQDATEQRAECCTFVENPYISALGTLYPCLLCHRDASSVGDVYTKGLAAALAEGVPLWTSLLQLSCDRGELAVCRDCPGKLICAGGCMGRAWGAFGDLLAPDDRCEVRRTVYSSR
ncbi:MAG TPA: radical SAM protein [Desulfuromonadales bacterium]|nr:radical SAM protein [Desulfuromonadales bacterium]